jgi:hypothetical protein
MIPGRNEDGSNRLFRSMRAWLHKLLASKEIQIELKPVFKPNTFTRAGHLVSFQFLPNPGEICR